MLGAWYDRAVRRRVPITTVFLLAGAVVNVAVAWGCAASWDIDELVTVGRQYLSHDETHELWLDLRRKSWSSEPSYLTGECLNAAGVTLVQVYHPHDRQTPWIDVTVVGQPSFGMPLSSLRYNTSREGREPHQLAGAITLGENRLPLRLIWHGFLINILFYAALLWLPIRGPFALRRIIRRHRGLCPSCGYPAGDSEVCSECGRPVTVQALSCRIRDALGAPYDLSGLAIDQLPRVCSIVRGPMRIDETRGAGIGSVAVPV